MSELNQLEDRLRAALSRIEAVAGNLPDPGDAVRAAQELAELKAQLEEERAANAQMIERVQALKDRQETQVSQLEEALAQAQTTDAEKTAVSQELKARVEDLRDQVARLTEANRAMVGNADLVNTAMMAELEAMRASRRADVAEIDDILSQLEPHIGGEAHA